MDKYTFIKAEFDKETGISTVIIKTDLGIFEGNAYLHDEDKDIASDFEGCKYAEWRAVIKYLKVKLKVKKIVYKRLKTIMADLERMKDYNKDSRESRCFRKQFYIAQKEVKDLKEYIAQLEENLYDMMKNYRTLKENYLKALENNRNKKSATE